MVDTRNTSLNNLTDFNFSNSAVERHVLIDRLPYAVFNTRQLNRTESKNITQTLLARAEMFVCEYLSVVDRFRESVRNLYIINRYSNALTLISIIVANAFHCHN